MQTWNWDESQSESGVVHESVSNTDHDNASVLKQGFDYQNFSEITPTPVLCFPFHEDSGSTAHDLVGANDGSISGAIVGQSGLLGTTSYSFDGTDDIVEVQSFDTQMFDGSEDWTFNAFVNIPSGASVDVGRYDQMFYPGPWDVTVSTYATYSSSGTSQFKIWDGSNDNVLNGSDIRGTGWKMITARYDTQSGMALFEDATEQDSNSFTGQPNIPEASTPEYIGIGDHPGTPPWDSMEGKIASVVIYDTALSQSQLQTLYDVVDTSGTWTSTVKSL